MCAIWAGKASKEDLANYEKRLQKASTFARPTRPTKVYLWKVAGDDDGDLPEDIYWLDVRAPVAARAVGEMWPIYPNSHKVYDARTDEWDICPALAPEDDLDDEALCAEYSDLPGTVAPLESPVKDSTFYDTELRLFYEGEEQCCYRPPFETFRSTTRFRHGLIPEVVDAANIAYDKYDDMNIRRYFGLVRENMDEDTLDMVKPASGFVDQLLKNPRDPWAPGIIWDLEDTCDHYLLTALPTTSILLYASDIDEAQHIEVRYKNDSQDIWWSLFVDETTALELCRRRDIVGLQEATNFLTQHGVRVTLAWQPEPRDWTGLQLVEPPPTYLGWRRCGFQPDGWDYKEYERQARELLSQPRGRAAILRGGIVWRLAVELLGEEGLRKVEGGLSADVWKLGREVSVRRGDPWYEDSLSTYELDLICGVYKVYTSKYCA